MKYILYLPCSENLTSYDHYFFISIPAEYIRGDFVILLNAACYSVINFLSPECQVMD